MNADTILVISERESIAFYRAIPLWELRVEFHPLDGSTDCINQSSPCLILIDCGFDENRGLSLLSEIKGTRPEIMVFFITDSGSEDTAVKAFRLGARDYFKKPIDLLGLKVAIENMLNLNGISGEKRLHFSSIGLDAMLSRCFRNRYDIPENLLRVISYAEKHLSEQLTIDLLAGVAGVSRFHFCRVYKNMLGMSPMRFLSLMRLERAKALLRKSIPVSAVAVKAGFNDLSNFNRQFKKFNGLTPSAYRDTLTPQTSA